LKQQAISLKGGKNVLKTRKVAGIIWQRFAGQKDLSVRIVKENKLGILAGMNYTNATNVTKGPQ